MSAPTPPHVAIVGSGPSGCYLAQTLLRALPGTQVTIVDRLPSPYGLVRYGVAADHQHTKAITRQFERLFDSPDVRFAGNLTVGHDLTLDELRAAFDVVVLATGLAADRELDIPGGALPGVHGAGAITRILNSHPDDPTELPELGSDVVVIGAGNVALDILRFLVKDETGYAASDVADSALASYLANPAQRVTVVSRSSAAAAKGDPQMLKELATLERARYRTPDPLRDPSAELDRTQQARVAAYEELVSAARPAHAGPEVELRFGLTPARIIGDERVEAVEFTGPDGPVVVPATAVITAIGFTAREAGSLAEFVATPSPSGAVAPGLYRTGWAKRGPSGAIPENRACAKSVADEIVADITSGALPVSPDTLGFNGLPAEVRDRAIGYQQWQVLDLHEREHAAPGRVRQKVADHDRMVAIARGAR